MGEMAEGLVNGDFDFYTGEYLEKGYGIPRTLGNSLPWENDRAKNGYLGICSYIDQKRGKLSISGIKVKTIVHRYCTEELKLEQNTPFSERVKLIQSNFRRFSRWVCITFKK